MEEQMRTELKLVESKVRKGEFPVGSERKIVVEKENRFIFYLIPFHKLTIVCQVVSGRGFVFKGPCVRENGKLVLDHQALNKLKSPGLESLR
ncbi:MAG: hypothetical protein A2508_06495 [Candidatus Lambdaproteobacteria bacterium RIFOXYD12_FULL_49_8]|nr:MAG: hypothetical protein A2508_06495 [Candidatus Lambdaproteobacteria bacterium RIFOXYD12_FULL_49_8]